MPIPDTFEQLALGAPIIQALNDVGYEKPSPIQAQTIPLLLTGRDVLGQAQTGTGKTAAFALPALSQIDLSVKAPQVLVLTPTRELAIQVAEAFKTYASHLKGFQVLPVYGGQDYRVQTRALERGVHVIVGTPGRIMDHIRRGKINLQQLKTFILDEADEMLRMGFIDDVEWVLEKLPEKRQTALFSATMPHRISRIAETYLDKPEIVKIEIKTRTADTIRQRFWSVTGRNKLDALTRILEAEEIDAMLVFVRTKTSTVEISEKLEARGYASAPLNGDIQQKQRERTVEQLKQGKLDIIVATDVAARGLDVARVSHVLNYDIPSDTEAYIHRIGRTGRAGRKGEAILFVAPRETRMKQTIERAIGKSIDPMKMPSTDEINQQRIGRFKARISDTINAEDLSFFESLIESYTKENSEHTATQIAAALAHLLQGDVAFLQPVTSRRHEHDSQEHKGHEHKGHERRDRDRNSHERRGDRSDKRTDRDSDRRSGKHPTDPGKSRAPIVQHNQPRTDNDKKKIPMELYRIEVGQMHEVRPTNIVGAIANEAGLESQFIGSVEIHDKYSTVELPDGMPKAIFKDLKKVWVCGQQLQITKVKREPGSFDKTSERPQKHRAQTSHNHKGHSEGKFADDRRGPKKHHSKDRQTDSGFKSKKRSATSRSDNDQSTDRESFVSDSSGSSQKTRHQASEHRPKNKKSGKDGSRKDAPRNQKPASGKKSRGKAAGGSDQKKRSKSAAQTANKQHRGTEKRADKTNDKRKATTA